MLQTTLLYLIAFSEITVPSAYVFAPLLAESPAPAPVAGLPVPAGVVGVSVGVVEGGVVGVIGVVGVVGFPVVGVFCTSSRLEAVSLASN